MTRNFAAFRANVASLMKQIAVSHRPMEVSDEVCPQREDLVVLHHLFQDQPDLLVNSRGLAVTTDQRSQIGSPLYLTAPGMVLQYPEMVGEARGTNQGCKPSLPQATRGRQQTTTTQGEGASGTGRRKGGVGEGLRIPGWWTTSPPIRSISSLVVWTAACQRKQALGAVAAYLMLITPSFLVREATILSSNLPTAAPLQTRPRPRWTGVRDRPHPAWRCPSPQGRHPCCGLQQLKRATLHLAPLFRHLRRRMDRDLVPHSVMKTLRI